jgi:hypothetical protein
LPRIAGDDADRQALLHQHRPLLDMQLEEALDPRRIELLLARPDALGRKARFGHVLRQRAAGVGPPAVVERVGLEQAEGGAAADIGRGKPRQLLGAHAHHRDVVRRLPVRHGPARQHRHAGDDARRAVVVAALRHRIEVRAGHDRGQAAVAPGQSQVEIAGASIRFSSPSDWPMALHQLVRHLLAVAVGGAGDAERLFERARRWSNHWPATRLPPRDRCGDLT